MERTNHFGNKSITVSRRPWSIERSSDFQQPYVTAGNRVYSIASQHGEFPEIGWRQPGEMSGVWDHPFKLLDGFWFGISMGNGPQPGGSEDVAWLVDAKRWRIVPGEIEITYEVLGLEVTRREYGVDDHEGMIIQLQFRNATDRPLACMLHFLARTDLRAAWLGENRLAWRDGRDRAVYLDEDACIAAYNTVKPISVLFGAGKRPTTVMIDNDLWATQQTRGQGISGQLLFQMHVPAQASEVLSFVIAGSIRSSEAARETYRQLLRAADVFRDRQLHRYQQVIARSDLFSGDDVMDTTFGWAKVTLQMLERHVPGIGHGISAGLADYPWWFGKDTVYSTLPLVASGQFELALVSLRNLARKSQVISPRGGVVHEILTQGHVHDPGHLVEMPLFVRAVYHAFCWSGDTSFLQELYGFCKRGMLDLVLGSADDDGDLCATGKGLVETRELQQGPGFETVDIAAYTYEALLCLAELASAVGDDTIVPDLREKAQALRDRLNSVWWIEEEGLFGDVYTSAATLAASNRSLRAEGLLTTGDLIELEQSQTMLDDYVARTQADWGAMSRERPWLLKHMIAAIPMETHLATVAHAERALTRLESNEFTGPWGIYLNPERQPVTMTLPNGIMAVAEAQYHRMDQALHYCHLISSTFSDGMPGAFSEIAPDGGSFIQAWSSYGIIWPVVHHFFGFRPHAAARSMRFVPHLPQTWNNARLQAVRVGASTVNLAVSQGDHEIRVVLETSDPAYTLTLGCFLPEGKQPTAVLLNETSVAFQTRSEEGELWQQTGSGWSVVLIDAVTGQSRYELFVRW